MPIPVLATTQFPASINVNDLNRQAAVAIDGAAQSDLSGSAAKGIRDVDGDGKADLIIGAPYNSGKGAAYLIRGQPGMGSNPVIQLGNLDSQTGVAIPGVAAGGLVGADVGGGGDYDGDGRPDLLIGAPGYSAIASQAGAGHVIFGKPDITASNPALSDSFTLTESSVNSALGFSVDDLGDFNLDGKDDYSVGEPSYLYDGGVTIIFGGSSVRRGISLPVSGLTSNNGVKLPATSSGPVGGAQFGFVVKGLGDVSGDGAPDLAVSSPLITSGGTDKAGRIYIFFGGKGVGSSGTISSGLTISGIYYGDRLGSVPGSIGSGDVNGDGKRDVILSAPFASFGGKTEAGIVYVVYGKSDIGGSSHAVFLTDLTGPNGFQIPGLQAGGKLSVVSAGRDVSGDGKPDLVLGAPGANLGAGVIYIIFGGNSAIGGTGIFDLATLDGTNGMVITGAAVGDHFGTIVSLIDDVTGDGIDDLLVTAPTASPGGLGQAGRSHVIFGDTLSTLNTNSLTVQKGRSTILTRADISGSALNHPDRDPFLQFQVSDVQEGQFELTSQPGVAITVFTQKHVTDGQVKFVHNNSVNPPSYKIMVSTGGMARHTPVPATVTFTHLGPSLVNNNLILNQGQEVILTPHHLSAISLDNPISNPNLVFTINPPPLYGRFEYVGSPGVTIIRFTQKDIDEGRVKFISDGSTHVPQYTVTVSDGGKTTPPSTAAVSFNGAPVIVKNALKINQGQKYVLTPQDLSAIDPNGAPENLVFTVYGLVQHGHFEFIDAPGAAITSFTQAQVQSGRVQFVPDGSLNAPNIAFTVSDGDVSSDPQATLVTFNAAPSLNNNNLEVSQGGRVILSTSNFSATDPDNSASTLTFHITPVTDGGEIKGGQFEFIDAPGVAITSFTQGDVQAGKVQFVQDGTTTVPTFNVAVGDGKMMTMPQAAIVKFSPAPLLVNNNLNCYQGKPVVLSSGNLSAKDATGLNPNLLLTVKDVTHGRFELTNNPGFEVTSFTQGQVQSGNVIFVPDKSINQPRYTVSVSDGKASSVSQASTITFKLAPIIQRNALTVNQGQATVLTLDDLSANNLEENGGPLTFTVSRVQHGYFEFVGQPGTKIETFTQEDIQQGRVQFMPDASGLEPSYWVTVDNGRAASVAGAQMAIVTFHTRPAFVQNHFSLLNRQPIILTTADLSASDAKVSAGSLIFSATTLGGHFEDINSPGVPLLSFAQQRVIDGGIKFIPDASGITPQVNMSVSNGILSSLAAPTVINLNEIDPVAGDTGGYRKDVIGACVAGAVSLGFLGVKMAMTHKHNQAMARQFAEEASDAEKALLKFDHQKTRPIAEAIFKRVSVSGVKDLVCCEDKTEEYLDAVNTIIESLEREGVDVHLDEMGELRQARLLREIGVQTKTLTVGNYSRCSWRYPLSFFRVEVTPQQLKDKADDIAKAVANHIGRVERPASGQASMEMRSMNGRADRDHGQRIAALEGEVGQLRQLLRPGAADAGAGQQHTTVTLAV